MKGGFPPSPKPIQGIPMLQSLIELIFHLCRCAQTQRSPTSATMNLLFCAAPCNVNAFLTTEACPDAFAPFPPEVPNVPDYTACVNDNGRATVRATHAWDKKMQADILTMNTALTNIFLEAMSSQVRASFQQRHLCKPNIVFVDLFPWFVNQYSKTTARIARQTGSSWPPIGTLPTGLMPSSSASSPELRIGGPVQEVPPK